MGGFSEPLGAGRIEAERDRRTAVFIERWLRVDQPFAADHYPLAHHVLQRTSRRVPFVRRVQELGSCRDVAAPRLRDRGADIDQAKHHLGGAAKQAFDSFGIVDAGKLNQDAIGSLALDSRLAHTGLVDATPYDLDRLLDRRVTPFPDGFIGQGNRHDTVGGSFHFDVVDGAAHTQDPSGDRIGQSADQLHALLALLLAQQPHSEGSLSAFAKAIANALATQGGPRGVDQRFNPLLDQRIDVDFEHQMRSALQVEAETDLLVRQPAWQVCRGASRHQVG